MITNFNDLLGVATGQDQPQRLLLLFANADSIRKKSGKQHTGTITPVMCVDKLPEEIDSFEALVEEADRINSDWNFIIIAGLSGEHGRAPRSEEADPYLNQMVNALAAGEDLSRYVIFDREQNPVAIQ